MKANILVISILTIFSALLGCGQGNDMGASENTGKAGSTARFAIVGEQLLTLDVNHLSGFKIHDESQVTPTHRLHVGWQMETIFPVGNRLFLGSTNGMHIYEVNNQGQFQFLSLFEHSRSCDPVVVDGPYAWVTLRSGANCRDGQNQLMLIGVENLEDPKLLQTWDLTNPHGLAINQGRLYICDGASGLAVFDISQTPNVQQLDHYSEFQCQDIIAVDDRLILTGEAGVTQIRVQGEELVTLSTI